MCSERRLASWLAVSDSACFEAGAVAEGVLSKLCKGRMGSVPFCFVWSVAFFSFLLSACVQCLFLPFANQCFATL